MSLVIAAGVAAFVLVMLIGRDNTRESDAEAATQQEVVNTRPDKKRDRRMEPKRHKTEADDPYVQGRSHKIGGDAANTGDQHDGVQQRTVEHEERTPLRITDAAHDLVDSMHVKHVAVVDAMRKVGGGIGSFFLELQHEVDKAKESTDKQPEFVGVLGNDQHLSDP